jgi:hypothetical protein
LIFSFHADFAKAALAATAEPAENRQNNLMIIFIKPSTPVVKPIW